MVLHKKLHALISHIHHSLYIDIYTWWFQRQLRNFILGRWQWKFLGWIILWMVLTLTFSLLTSEALRVLYPVFQYIEYTLCCTTFHRLLLSETQVSVAANFLIPSSFLYRHSPSKVGCCFYVNSVSPFLISSFFFYLHFC